MKLVDSILFSLAVAFFIIGVHQFIIIGMSQTFTDGFIQSYWLFMLTSVLLLFYNIRKKKHKVAEKESNKHIESTNKKASPVKRSKKLNKRQ